MQSSSPIAAPERENLAGLVERVTFHNPENGFCVLRVKVRGQRDLATVVGAAAAITAGEFIQASGSWINDRTHGVQFIRDPCRLTEDRLGVARAETPGCCARSAALGQGPGPELEGAAPASRGEPRRAGPVQSGLLGLMAEAAAPHPQAGRAELWFIDEARVSRKSRTTHVWYEKGMVRERHSPARHP
jgi:hypothetical protein